MKLTIFGSTGGTGRQIVTQALEQGHAVTAFARNPERLGLKHERLQVAQGNVTEPDPVKRAIQGQDAVLCGLGLPPMNKDMVRAKGTENIIRAMTNAGCAPIRLPVGAWSRGQPRRSAFPLQVSYNSPHAAACVCGS